MTHKKCWIVIIIASLIISCGHSKKNNLKLNKTSSNSSVNYSENINFIKRNGNSFNKGKQYGASVKEEIKGQLDIWSNLCKEEIGLTQAELFTVLNEKTGFLKAIKQHAPDLLEEINGMAEAAEVEINDLLCFNLLEETIVYFTRGYDKCTNIGLKKEKENIIAYNLDLPDFLRKYKPIVLQDSNQLIYGFPGIIATGGMNKNFAITTNSLPNLNMDLNGLPLPFLIRKLLQFTNEQEAINYLKSTPFGNPQNIMIVGRQGVNNFECSANQIAKYENPKNDKVLYHTNHAKVNTDIRNNDRDLNCKRFNYLDSVFADHNNTNEINISEIKEAIKNEESEIKYKGNYFSFIATYPKDKNESPYIEVLVPISNNATILSFNKAN